jgi:hypothetical protein
VGLLRKSKRELIKLLTAALGAVILVGAATAARPAPLRLVRVAVDRTTTPASQHATIVEPDAVAVGSRIVTTFQVGRLFGGSATAIGFARSTDAGRTWRTGLLPGTAGTVMSDPVVAYDTLHRTWLISTLVNSASTSSLFVYTSADGLTWSAPVTAVSYPRDNTEEGTVLDKEWLACDTGGGCYLAYTDLAHDIDPRRRGTHIGVQGTTDGGLTWSTPVLLEVDADQVSPAVQPVVRANGELVIVFFEDGLVEAVRSTDGGATFAPREQIADLEIAGTQPLRGFSLPSATVDRAGQVYVAWPDCRFRRACRANDIVWSRSSGPGIWTPVQRATRGTANFTLPDIAVDGSRLAVSYYALSPSGLDVYLSTSKTAGRTWAAQRRLNPTRMNLTWLARTASGRMVGDYMGTVFSGSRVVVVHVQARAPRGDTFNEALYAASLPRP